MNNPPVLNAYLFPSAEQNELGSVESSLLLRLMRPVSLGPGWSSSRWKSRR
jgi:hypothetical protein